MGLDDQHQTIYTLFGLIDQEDCEVKVDEIAPEDALPENEEHRGVHVVEIRLYGDSTDGGFMSVNGTDLEHVTIAYGEAREGARELLKRVWTAVDAAE